MAREPSDRWLLWVVALALLAGACSPRDLWAPDEPRYGQVAREMLRDGNWLVPTRNGELYAEKPPIFYWAVALLSMPLGDVTAVTARLVGALCAIGCLFAIQRLARRWFGAPGPPGTAVVLFAGTLLVAWNGPRAGLDLPLTCALLWAVERGGTWLRQGGAWPAIGMGTCWALAILVKGPLGFLLPPALVAAEGVALRHRPRGGDPGWWLVPLVMVGLCLAWLLPALAYGTEAYRERLLGQIEGRITGEERGHVRPLYYYLVNWPVWTLPCAGLLALGAWASIRPGTVRGEARAGLRAALVAGPLLFVGLSLTATKRELYLVPGLPFTALAAAWVLERGLWPRLARGATWVFMGSLAVFALVLPLLPWLASLLLVGRAGGERAPLGVVPWAALALAALAAGVGAVRAWRARAEPVRAVRGAAPLLFAALAVLHLGYLPAADPYKSMRPVAQAAEQAAGPQGTVWFGGLHEGTNLLWALDRPRTPRVADAAALAAALGPGQPRGSAVLDARFWEQVRREASGDPELGRRLSAVREAWRDQADIRELVVVTNAPEPGVPAPTRLPAPR
ncbi:MAG: ArnT family glycosyltransferase [Planctomycetia bacterium]